MYTSPVWQRPHELPEDSPPIIQRVLRKPTRTRQRRQRRASIVSTITTRTRRYHNQGAAARRRLTGSTSDLDTLLQRSVHALEMSNALLQSHVYTIQSIYITSGRQCCRSLLRQEYTEYIYENEGNGICMRTGWMIWMRLPRVLTGYLGKTQQRKALRKALSVGVSLHRIYPPCHTASTETVLNLRTAALSDTGLTYTCRQRSTERNSSHRHRVP